MNKIKEHVLNILVTITIYITALCIVIATNTPSFKRKAKAIQ